MEEEHQDLDKPIYGDLKITQSREETDESKMKTQKSVTTALRDLSCCYSLRENPKKKTQKSPETMKKNLFRCDECGKEFRYEKCFSNHLAVMHLSTNQKVYEESMMSLCRSFSLVRKKKRSSLIRYKKTSFSCSFTTFPESRSVFAANDEELEVAECLILLSKSTPKFLDGLKLDAEAVHVTPETPKGSFDLGCLRNKKLRKGGEFESGVFGNEQRLMEEWFSNYGTPKEPGSFLREDNRLDQQKRRKEDEFESGVLSNKQRLLEEEITTHKLDQLKLCKAGDFKPGFDRTELGVRAISDTEMITEYKKNVEHKCRLCNKIFSSYQALGGHQTCHRMRKSKNKKNSREESVEPEDESVMKRRRHTSVASDQ